MCHMACRLTALPGRLVVSLPLMFDFANSTYSPIQTAITHLHSFEQEDFCPAIAAFLKHKRLANVAHYMLEWMGKQEQQLAFQLHLGKRVAWECAQSTRPAVKSNAKGVYCAVYQWFDPVIAAQGTSGCIDAVYVGMCTQDRGLKRCVC